MNYNISSSSFDEPFLKPLFENLVFFFNSIQTRFFIIGATARNIILAAHGEKSGRATYDLDLAIAVHDWDKYWQIETGLIKTGEFEKDTKQKQRFIYKGVYKIDLLPYGDIMKLDDKIFWPPDEETALSVLGFAEVGNAADTIVIDEKLTLHSASLAGICLLKIVAWADRHQYTNKDAEDLGFILLNYFHINEERVYKLHLDLYEKESFSIITAGARLIGRDMAVILTTSLLTRQKIIAILNDELQKKEDSKLLNQIIETNRILKFQEILICIELIVHELKT